ncbi:zinc-ribbon domain containing protein [Tahibacter sp.]|uniref:zinc-ribbon domain containing protein n=1 Tax=Tahibacter sp. TaxID=2056211 RepID=UPI0028C3F448|nr:zinc-ribbon domain containing protein [Tahibacter sp.]
MHTRKYRDRIMTDGKMMPPPAPASIARRRLRPRPAVFGLTLPVDVTRLGRNHSAYDIPAFVQRGYYVDITFACKDCGIAGVWATGRQKWWYEIAKGDMWTTATRCPRCRRLERERVAAARLAHAEGERSNASLDAVAERWLHVDPSATRRPGRKRPG